MTSYMVPPTIPPVATICGSMRFFSWMLEIAREESYAGVIILMPFVIIQPENQPTSSEKRKLDVLHMQKILMSDSIIVATNDDIYVGESTTREISVAKANGKKIKYMFKTMNGMIATVKEPPTTQDVDNQDAWGATKDDYADVKARQAMYDATWE